MCNEMNWAYPQLYGFLYFYSIGLIIPEMKVTPTFIQRDQEQLDTNGDYLKLKALSHCPTHHQTG